MPVHSIIKQYIFDLTQFGKSRMIINTLNQFRVLLWCSCFLILVQCKSKNPKSDKPKENPPVVVDIMIAAKQPISHIIEANGTVLANEYTELRPEATGKLSYLNVAEGKDIAKGTLIARVDDAD